jgi:hypothetical protein
LAVCPLCILTMCHVLNYHQFPLQFSKVSLVVLIFHVGKLRFKLEEVPKVSDRAII